MKFFRMSLVLSMTLLVGCLGMQCGSSGDGNSSNNSNSQSNTNNNSESNTNANSNPPKAASQEKLEMHTMEWEDDSRKTPSVKGEPGAETRTFKVWAWVGPMKEEQAGTYPLLMMAHGLGGHPDKFKGIASYFANQGMMVVSVRFPMTNRDAPAGAPAGMFDLEQQPSDMTYVLNKLLEQVKDESSPFFRRFDPNKVIAMGHSLGGATVLGWTRFACCKDERIKASVLVAPSTNLNSAVFKAAEPSKEGPPTLIIHGVKDEVLQYSVSEKMYDAFTGTVFFLGLKEALHSDLLESSKEPPIPVRDATQRVVAAFVKEFANGEKGATQSVLDELGKSGEVVKSKK